MAPLLGGEERFEQLAEVGVRDSGSMVGDADGNLVVAEDSRAPRAELDTQPPAGAIASAAFTRRLTNTCVNSSGSTSTGRRSASSLRSTVTACRPRTGWAASVAASSSVSTVVTSTRGARGFEKSTSRRISPSHAGDLAIQRLCGIDDFGTPGNAPRLAGPAAERRPSFRRGGSIPRGRAWPRARRLRTASRSASSVAGARRAPRRSLRASRPARPPARPVLRDRRGRVRPEFAYAQLPTGPGLRARRSAS